MKHAGFSLTVVVLLGTAPLGAQPVSLPYVEPTVQRGSSQRDPTKLFSFTPKAATGIGPARLKQLLEEWGAAIDQHEPGAVDWATESVSLYSHNDLANVVLALEAAISRTCGRGTLDECRRMIERARRASVLHTDIATTVVAGAGSADRTGMAPVAALHFGVAMELADWLRANFRNEAAFQRQWYGAIAAFLVSQYEIGSSPLFLNRAVSLFPRDADLLLLAGAVNELLASPRIHEGADVGTAQKAEGADRLLSRAEGFYRRAVDANPQLPEARLRLGRVMGQRGQHDKALAELTAAAREAPTLLPYFTRLFIGEEEEALGHREAARDSYRQTIDLRPNLQFGYLGLSRLERRNGNKGGAVAAVDGMLDARGGQPGDDPWAEYYAAGLARQAEELLEQMRAPLRRKQ